jgi:hypothetical protein
MKLVSKLKYVINVSVRGTFLALNPGSTIESDMELLESEVRGISEFLEKGELEYYKNDGTRVGFDQLDEVKEELKEDVKVEPAKEPAKEDVKVEPAKEDVKVEPTKEPAKEEPKEDVKVEPAKEEVKEEVKVEPAKEDVKEDVKKE